MTDLALALALASAVLHAVWNLLLVRHADTQAATAVAFAAAWVAGLPAAALDPHVAATVWPYALASGLLELLYVALLATAYARSELSAIYPVARGSAPVIVLAVGVVALRTATTARQAVGVCLVGLGVLLVRRLRFRGDLRAVGLAFAVAATIAGYTLVDRHGVRHASPFVYFEAIMLPAAVVYPAAVAVRGRRSALRRAVVPPNVLAGALVWAAYALVLEALRRAEAAPVAAVRESSVVFATALAALVLRERVGVVRLAGAVLVAAGVALVGA